MKTNRDRIHDAIGKMVHSEAPLPDETETSLALRLSSQFSQSGLTIQDIETEIRQTVEQAGADSLKPW